MNEKCLGNPSAEKMLLKAYENSNRARNRILTVVMGFSICLMFCLFSLAYGKLQADALKNIRTDGSIASAYLENGTEQQEEQLKKLPYVSLTGKEKIAGKLMDHSVKYCDCVVLDAASYEEFIMPAYTDIRGNYPKEADEIMLSVKTLEYLGISNPKVGMTLSLEFYWNDLFHQNRTGKQPFVLSGYFTEYRNQAADSSIAYLSEQLMKESDISWTPSRIFIKSSKNVISGERLEYLLNRDVFLEGNQQFFCNDSALYRAIEGILGSFGMAATFSLLVLLGTFLFVYNVMNISMGHDIQQYGLLGVLGVTNRQTSRIIWNQMLKSGVAAAGVGGCAGCFIVYTLFPKIMEKMYLGNTSAMNGGTIFSWGLFLLVLSVNFIALICTAFITMKKLKHLSPLEAMKYEEKDDPITFHKEKEKMPERTKRWLRYHGNPIYRLAWINLLKNKKTLILTIFSIILGCEIALCSSMLVKGVDLRNKFLMNPDFEIGTTQNACITLIENSPDTWKMTMFPDDVIEEARNIGSEEKDSFHMVEGYIPIVDREGNESIKVLTNGMEYLSVIQKIDVSDVERLKAYIDKTETKVDWETFLHHNGTFLLHHNRLSEDAAKDLHTLIGKSIGVFDLVPVGTDMRSMKAVPLVNCGYLNIHDKNFPEMDFCWDGENTNILLVSENTFHELSETLTEQTFQISFRVVQNRESIIKNELKQFIRQKNMEFQSQGYSDKLNLFYLTCNSDLMAEEEDYVISSSIILSIVSTILMFIGIGNYLNARVTDMMLRKKENVLLECVGLTKRQICFMLILEGFYYWLIVIGILAVFGTGVLFVLGYFMKLKLSYFIFQYPLKAFLMIGISLLLFCIFLPNMADRSNKGRHYG